MSIRINASGDILKRTAGLPSSTAFTMCGWAKMTTRGSIWQLWGIEDGLVSASNYNQIGFDDSGNFVVVSTGSPSRGIFASSPPDNTWVFWGLTCGGTGATDLKGYWKGLTDTTFNTASCGGSSFTSALMTLGNDSWDEYCNSAFANVKIYDAVLTETELHTEMWSVIPKRYSNLHLWSPLWSTSDAKDYGSALKDWTSGGSLTTEEHPPIPWGYYAQPIYITAAGSSISDAVTESTSATDSPSAAANFIPAQTETVSAADTPSSVYAANPSQAESLTAVDSVSAVVVTSASVTEPITASDSVDAIFAFPVSITETLPATDTVSALATMPAEETSAGTALEISSSAIIAAVTQAESNPATESQTAIALFAAAITEASSATDVSATTSGLDDGVIETISANDIPSAIATLPASQSESNPATESQTAITLFVAAITEASSATDVSATTSGLDDGVIETISANDIPSAIATLPASQSEINSATDVQNATAVLNVAIVETASALDAATEISGGVVIDGYYADLFFGEREHKKKDERPRVNLTRQERLQREDEEILFLGDKSWI